MNTTLLIIVLLLGVVLLALEIVALPGGIAGFFGVLLIAFGVWQTYALFNVKVGTIVLLCSIALCIVLLIIFMKRRTWSRFSLNEQVDSRVNQIEKTLHIGDHGKTISRLAPTGKAVFADQQVEVHAINKFINPDSPIVIVAIEGYRIDVVEASDIRFEQR